jgi:hypothetical protein
MAESDTRRYKENKENPDADQQIKDWMRRFPYGYYITHPENKDQVMLHRVKCTHATGRDGPETKLNLAKNEKVCSPYKDDLIELTKKQFDIEPRRCAECKP